MPKNHSKSNTIQLSPPAARAVVCRRWLHLQALVEETMGKALANRPYWLTLLELYLAELEQRAMFSSCFLTGETPSNVHRRLIRLAALGGVTRQTDPTDHRRVDLKLTGPTRQGIEKVLDAVIAFEAGLTGNCS